MVAIHKANILKLSDGLFLRSIRDVARGSTDIGYDEKIIDAACMSLVMAPEKFDVLVLPNLYGDIVSDLGAGLVGGLGVVPGANMGETCAVFEAVHGSAPDIADKNLANPTALLLSGLMMLDHIGEREMSARIRAALGRIFRPEPSARAILAVRRRRRSSPRRSVRRSRSRRLRTCRTASSPLMTLDDAMATLLPPKLGVFIAHRGIVTGCRRCSLRSARDTIPVSTAQIVPHRPVQPDVQRVADERVPDRYLVEVRAACGTASGCRGRDRGRR